MNIFEILEKKEMSPAKEYRRLISLLDYQCYEDGLGRAFRCYIDDIWPNLTVRQTCVDMDDLFRNLDLRTTYVRSVSWEKLFLLCELLKNILVKAKSWLLANDDACHVMRLVESNISVILEKTNQKWVKLKKGYVIVKKDIAVDEAIECLEKGNEDLALNMYEYNRSLLTGNLERKREILTSMASYVEPWKNEMKGTIYFPLYMDSRELVNKLNIRHNNTGKGTIPEYAKKWTKKDYEAWYDKTFQTLLMVILSKRQLKITQEMNKMKFLLKSVKINFQKNSA